MSMTPSRSNSTHRKRLARRLAEAEHIPYSTALQRVRAAAAAGSLPEPLDDTGMAKALDTLRRQPGSAAHSRGEAADATWGPTSLTCVYCDALIPGAPGRDGWDPSEQCPGQRGGGAVAFFAAGLIAVRALHTQLVAAGDRTADFCLSLLAEFEQAVTTTEVSREFLVDWGTRLSVATENVRVWAMDGGIGDAPLEDLAIFAAAVHDDFASIVAEEIETIGATRDVEIDLILSDFAVPVGEGYSHLPGRGWLRNASSSLEGAVAPDARASGEAAAMHLEPRPLRLLRKVWQGRVSKDRVETRTGPAAQWRIDNRPGTGADETDLLLLERDGYITADLPVTDEWVVARTTDFGDQVLAANDADTDKFRDGLPPKPTTTDSAPASAPAIGDREPYVGEGADGARRSAQIDLDEADSMATGPHQPGWSEDVEATKAELRTSAARWEAQAERQEEQAANEEQRVERTQVWFVAHDDDRCEATSWRGTSGARTGPYGPGGFNRCVKSTGHHPLDGGADQHHLDEWGHLFTLTKTNRFRVVGQVSNSEMADVARSEGRYVDDKAAMPPGHPAGRGRPEGGLRDGLRVLGPDNLPKRGTLWVTGEGETVKVSEIYGGLDASFEGGAQVSAQVVYPVPPRTTVRFYPAADTSTWREPTSAEVRRYERAWDFAD